MVGGCSVRLGACGDMVDEQVEILPDAVGIGWNVYSMTIREVLESRRYSVVTPETKVFLDAVSMYAPNRYPIMLDHLKQTLRVDKKKLTKENINAGLVALGTSILQNRYQQVCRALKKFQDELTQTNFQLACELFYQEPRNIFDYQTKGNGKAPRGHVNIFIPHEQVHMVLSTICGCVQISKSEGFAIAWAEGLLTWDGLPESARPLFQHDIDTFDMMAQKKIERILQHQQAG